ncbi:MAG: DUF3450 domain-containing protein [Sutterellaceae bacterium]|nr:DUF3450 domain-containing protein [Sutterellaceae bacterium]
MKIKNLIASALLVWSTATFCAADLGTILDKDRQGTQASVRAHEKIEGLVEDLDQARQIKQQADRESLLLESYCKRLEDQLERIRTAKRQIEEDRVELRRVRMNLFPLMQSMVEKLSEFVAADIPFLKEERAARLEHLKEAMDDATLSEAQKIDLLLDAYQVEVSYGYTVAGYQAKDENGRLSDFLRIGRLGFYSVSPDAGTARQWSEGEWKTLEAKWNDPLVKAVLIASGKLPPDLIFVPALEVKSSESVAQNSSTSDRKQEVSHE